VRAQRFDERGEPVDELRRAGYTGDDPDEIVRLAVRAEFEGPPPQPVADWLDLNEIEV
jgi:hypothetical protein